MVNLQNHDNEFSVLFEHIRACETEDGVVMISDASREELDEIRVLREAVQETMEIPQVYFTQS
jgi:hypothetical protein